MRASWQIVGILMVSCAMPTLAWARGGGGGGGRGGGGGARPGGAAARPAAPAARPAPAPSRPAASTGAARSPSMSRQGGANVAAGGANRPVTGAGATSRPAGASGRPTEKQVGEFLNLPSQPKTAGSGATTAAARGTSGSKTATGPGGGSVTVGGVGGSRTGPGGTTVGAGRVGVKVTGPGGNSYTKVAGGAAVRGPWGNTVAAGRGASFVNGQFVGGKTWSAVNGNFTHWNYYGAGWAGRYPGCWWPGKWAVAGTIWAATSWATAGSYCGCEGEPAYYDYDENMSYQDGQVYYGDENLGSAEQYYQQTAEIAASGADATNEDWLPLGVYGVVTEGASETEKTLQLAVNKDGVIRGNYHDLVADQVTPITGAVDKMTQRVALKLESNKDLVAETGLYNLTNDEVPVLLHLGPDQQESRVLVRLKQPEDAKPE